MERRVVRYLVVQMIFGMLKNSMQHEFDIVEEDD
jgi:hypothetical protein